MNDSIRKFVVVSAVLACWTVVANAQVTAGENTSLNLGGDISAGYSGSYGDTILSNHGFNFGGNGRMNGFYYNPKFLSFNVHPYYNRSQNNSNFQSITDSSGVDAGVDLFSGSRFPGAVAYGRSFEGAGQFGVPGINGFTTHGNASNFGITWSALFPKLPPVTVSYTTNNSDTEIFGANANSKNHTRNFNITSSYALDGFRFTGGYHRQSMSGLFPALFTGETAHYSDSTNNSYDLQTSHALPLQGQWFFGWNHSTFGGGYDSGSTLHSSNSGSVHVLNTGVVLNPISRLSLSFVSTYNSNVFGSLQQQLLEAGGDPSLSLSSSASKSLTLTGTAYFKLTNHIGLNGSVIRLNQYIENGPDFGLTQYGGGVNMNYAFKWLGTLTFNVGAVQTASERGNGGASLVGNVNFARRFGHWESGASFSYTQQVQTMLATYTTSMYNYNANLRRRFFNGLQWTGVVHGSHSGFAREPGSSSHAEGGSSTISWGHFAMNGVASRSGGISILTAQGLVTLPDIPPELLHELILYNARSYGAGGSLSIKRATFTFNYAHALSETHNSTSSSFDTTLMNARLMWRLRKLNVNGGYTKLDQGFVTTTGFRPTVVNTFYIGVSRWFNVF